MAEVILDFEKPIYEMEEKLAEWEKMEKEQSMDLAEELRSLRNKIEETRKNIYSNLTPWQKVQMARHVARPYTLDYIERIFTDFLEFHGDRRYADDPAIVGGFAKLDNMPVMVIGTQKGRNTKDNVFRNFGCPHPEGYRKALRLMKMAEVAKTPIITFIDTPGAFPGIASEERHIGEAIAVNLREMFALKVPVIAVVIGEGGSGGALALGVGNTIMILENAYYSVITPEGCAAILWKDRAYSEKAAEALRLTAKDLRELGLVDTIVKEPLGGAHKDYDKMASYLKKALKEELKKLEALSPEKLCDARYEKFRKIAFYLEEAGAGKE